MNTNPIFLLLHVMMGFLTRLHLAGRQQVSQVSRLFPDGRVLFHNNQVTFSMEVESSTQIPAEAAPARGEELGNQAIFSTLLISLDDISLAGNQFQATVPPLSGTTLSRFTHVACAGTTIRAVDNGFAEPRASTRVSYTSLALAANVTTGNEATHNFVTATLQSQNNIETNNVSLHLA